MDRDSTGVGGRDDLESLQILRFLAAASVVYLHLSPGPAFGAFGVDIFFVLSGFVIALVVSRQKSPAVFAVDRATRIVPLYWLMTTLLYLLILVDPRFVHESTAASASFGNYLRSLFFVPYYGASDMKPLLRIGWTLNYEMLFYACVWVGLLLCRRFPLALALFLLVCLYGLPRAVTSQEPLGEFLGSELVFEFALGVAAWRIHAARPSRRVKELPMFLVSVLAYGFMVGAERHEFTGSRLVLFGIPSFLLVLCGSGLENLVRRSNRAVTSTLVSMGDASYATYLTHWFVIVLFRKVLAEQLHLFDFYSTTGMVVTLCAALAVGQVTYKYVDRPLCMFLKRRFRSYLT